MKILNKMCFQAGYITVVFLLLHFIAYTQTLQEKYDLDFGKYNTCNWDWNVQQINKETVLINSGVKEKHLLISYSKAMNYFLTDSMYFLMRKDILIPEVPFSYNSINVFLDIKNVTHNSLTLRIKSFNKEEDVLMEDSINVSISTKWEKLKLAFPSKDVQSILVSIEYKGDANIAQKVSLRDVKICLDDKEINHYPITEKYEPLIKKYITELDTKDSSFSNVIFPLKFNNARIIGLGEATHGSGIIHDFQNAFLKKLIQEDSCKLILLELNYMETLLYNFYVQGIINDTSNIIKRSMKSLIIGENLYDFLIWLRNYNSHTENKVYCIGIDQITTDSKYFLMNLYMELLGVDFTKKYLAKLYYNDPSFELSKKILDSAIKKRLNNTNYALYHYATKADSLNKLTKNIFEKRDLAMYKNFLILDSIVDKSKTKIAIIAHSSHLQKNVHRGSEESPENIQPLGLYLYQKFKDDYYALNFTIGQGAFAQDSCSSTIHYMVDSIKNRPKNSFEYAALKSGSSNFFYPSDKLPDAVKTTLSITRNSQLKNNYKIANLQKRFDGIVFIKNSVPPKGLIKNYFTYSIPLFSEEWKRIKTILEIPPPKIGN